MLSSKDIVNLIADTYHTAALSGTDMRAATGALETIRSTMADGQEPFKAWNAIDRQVGKTEDPDLQAVLISLRESFENQVCIGRIDLLIEAFRKDPKRGYVKWLIAYAEALDHWRLTLCRTLCEQDFPFPEHAVPEVAKLRQFTKYAAHERWPDAYGGFVYLAEHPSIAKPIRAKMYVHAAEIQLYDFLKPEDAKTLLERAEKLAPKESRLISGWGRYWLQRNDFNKAKQCFQQVIDEEPTLADGYLLMGDRYERQSTLDAAEEWYREAIKVDSGSADGYIRLMRLYGRPELVLSHKTELHALLERAITINPENKYSYHIEMAGIHQQNREYDTAHHWLDKAIDLDESRLGGYIWKGYAYIEEAKYKDAITAFKKAISAAPEAFDGYWGLVSIHEQLEEWKEALHWCGESLLRRPSWESTILSKIGDIRRKLNQYEESEEELIRALRREPDNEIALGALHDLATDYYEQRNNREDALRLYKLVRRIKGKTYEASYRNRVGNLKYYYGEYKEAVEAYRMAVRGDSGVPVYHANLGLALRDLERWDQAEQAYRKAIELEPTNAEHHNSLGIVYYRSGEYEKAISSYERAIEINPDIAVYHANLGLALRDLERWEEAEQGYLEAIKLEPFSADHRNMLGILYYKSGDHQKAIASYEAAIEYDSSEAVYFSNRALAFRDLERWNEAELSYLEAIELDPDDADQYNMLGIVYYRSGNYEQAMDSYQKAIEREPGMAVYHANLGLALIDLERWDEAEREYLKAIELDPDEADQYNGLGIVYYRSGDNEKAIGNYRKAVKQAPHVAMYHANLGLSLTELERWAEAEKECLKATQLDPGNAEHHNMLGIVYYRTGKYENAVESYRKAINHSPDVALYHANLGLAFADSERWKEAEKEYLKAVELHPANPEYLNMMGIVYYRSGNYRKAINSYKRAIEKNSEVAMYHANLGLALRDLKRWNESEKEYLKAIELEPHNSERYNSLGILYYTRGDNERAIDSYEKAIERNPEVPVYYDNLGLAVLESEK